MVKGSSGNIQSYFKRQRIEAVAQDPPPAQPLPLLLELEQQHENQDPEPQTNYSVPLPVVFRGMEFLERDPALRPQIWQYPPNQRDSVRRSYLLLGPMQPKLKQYKASGKKGHQRRFHELDRRFNEKIMDLLSTSAKLVPRNKFKYFKGSDICELVKKYYPADFSQQDRYVLEQQLKLFVADASSDVELKNVSTLTDLCQLLVETGRDKIYHLIDRLLRLLVTLPVSTASAERAFSSLKIIKTRLRNKMEDENLANNLVVHIEREIAEKYNFEDILTEFKSMGDRRADL